jgi:magnesium chelatase family protein
MIATIATSALMGIDALPVALEIDFSRQGLPAFVMVGLAEGAVREAKERVFAALKSSDKRLDLLRVDVLLAQLLMNWLLLSKDQVSSFKILMTNQS